MLHRVFKLFHFLLIGVTRQLLLLMRGGIIMMKTGAQSYKLKTILSTRQRQWPGLFQIVVQEMVDWIMPNNFKITFRC